MRKIPGLFPPPSQSLSRPCRLHLTILFLLGCLALVTERHAWAQDASNPEAVTRLWSAAYGAGNLENGFVVPTGTGTYMLSAVHRTPSNGQETIIAQLDNLGRVREGKEIDRGTSNFDELTVSPVPGGYLVNGVIIPPGVNSTESTLIWAKFSSTWAKEYAKSFSGPGLSEGGNFYPTSDGGMLLLGDVQPSSTNCNYVLLLKVDAAGRLTWKSTVQHRCKAFSGQVLEVSDGYIVTGSESTGFLHEGNLVVWPTVMKISKAGAVLWAKKLTVAAPVPQPNQFLNGGGITELKDGSLLFAWAFWTGYPLPTDPTASWLVKMDPAGRIQWERVYRSAALEIGASNVVENADEGAFLLNGLVIDKATENRVLLILKINTATGGILKRMSIRHAGGNVTGTLFHANWGGLYFSGRQSSLSEIGPFLALFGKLNPTTLTPIWARTFDGGGESGAAIGTATGFLVAGDTEKYGTDPSGGNTFAATLDKNGNYSGCHVQAATLEAEIPTLKATTPPHKETDILFKAMNLGKAVNYPSLSVNTLALPVATICPSSTAAPAARCEQ